MSAPTQIARYFRTSARSVAHVDVLDDEQRVARKRSYDRRERGRVGDELEVLPGVKTRRPDEQREREAPVRDRGRGERRAWNELGARNDHVRKAMQSRGDAGTPAGQHL
jgi:hypothetical protein